MESNILVNFILVLVLGAFSQWMGWRYKIPSILILLVTGFLVGPVFKIFDPEAVLGDLLFPVVSAAVAIILFEGGLTLRFRDLKDSGLVIFRLVSIGVLVTWALAGFFAHSVLGLGIGIAALFGALLSVTGPTVIGPMLRTIRPKGKVNNIAKWEGILVDPIGVLLAVLVFEAIVFGAIDNAPNVMLWGLVKTVVIGIVFSGVSAGLLLVAIKAKLIPEFLHNLIVLTLVILSFEASNLIQEESGLLTVTLFGIIMANQSIFHIPHILHFKENLRLLLISSLFIVLAARVEPATVLQLDYRSLIFLCLLIFVVRPLAIVASTVGSSTTWKDRILLMMLAPRGIVAVALTSVLALKLQKQGFDDANRMLAETLLVVVGTVLFYGLLAGPVASRLKLSNLNPEGLLIIGAHSWARDLAAKLKEAGIYVAFIDTNRGHVGRARADGFDAYCGNVLSDEFLEELDLSEIGHAIALTQNNEVNTFAQTTLVEFIERADIHPLPPTPMPAGNDGDMKKVLNPLFSQKAHYHFINQALANGGKFHLMTVEEAMDTAKFKQHYGDNLLPLFVVDEDGRLVVCTEKEELKIEEGAKLLYLEIRNAEMKHPRLADEKV